MKPYVRVAASAIAFGTLAASFVPVFAAVAKAPTPAEKVAAAKRALAAKRAALAAHKPRKPVASQPAPSKAPVAPKVAPAPAKPAAPVVSAAPVPAKPAVQPAPAPAPQAAAPVPAPSVHTATVSYLAPSGNEDVGLSVTVADGKITAVSVENKATDGVSRRYQDSFAQGISGAVVGKKLSELNLSAVGGASLTTAAFAKYVRSF